MTTPDDTSSPAPSFAPRPARVTMRRGWLMVLPICLFLGQLGVQQVQLKYSRESLEVGREMLAERKLASRQGRTVDPAEPAEKEARRASLTAIADRAQATWFVVMASLFVMQAGFLFLPIRRKGLLRVSAEGVTIDGVLVVPHARMRQAVRFRSENAVGVRVDRKLALPCKIELDSEEDADDALRALSQDSRHATASFAVIRGGTSWWQAGLALFVAPLFVVFAGLAALVVFRHPQGEPIFSELAVPVLIAVMAAAVGFRHWFRSSRTLVVGADGILLRRPLRPALFYRYDQVTEVAREGEQVRLRFGPDAIEHFRFQAGGLKRFRDFDSADMAETLVARINDARALHAAGGSSSDLASVLARSDRDMGGWIRALKGVLGDAPTFRTPAIPPDRLWRVLEDPTQPAPLRAGAAVALRERLSDGDKERLRVVAATCASNDLRRALEVIERDDSDALEQALETVDPSPRRLRA